MGKKMIMKALVCVGFGLIGAADSYAAIGKGPKVPTMAEADKMRADCKAAYDSALGVCKAMKAADDAAIEKARSACYFPTEKPLVPPPINPSPVTLTMCLEKVNETAKAKALNFMVCNNAATNAYVSCVNKVNQKAP